MSGDIRLLMIGAMYENGGNLTHRLFDGHPELFVYPFESQLGTRYVNDALASLFPAKYRWPVFALHATPEEDYRAIVDEECRVRARTPHVSKFRHVPFEFDDDARGRAYVACVERVGRSQAHNVSAFFQATFEAWTNARRSGRESVYVGYSPIVTVDAERILREMPEAHLLHVIRNPWSAFAETCARPVPLSLETYTLGWTVTASYATAFRSKYPGRVHIVRAEDVMDDPARTLAPICEAIGVDPTAASLRQPSWNGTPLEEIRPWGTIRLATPAANRETARRLTEAQVQEIRLRTSSLLDQFDYTRFL